MNSMPSKEDFSRACNGDFLAVHDGFPAIAVRRPSFPSLETKVFPGRRTSWKPTVRVFPGLGKASGGSVQGGEPLVNQGEERFKRIRRAKFNVDTPDAGRQPGSNFKESQPNLADRGHFEFGAS
jgi:hypothetical protein